MVTEINKLYTKYVNHIENLNISDFQETYLYEKNTISQQQYIKGSVLENFEKEVSILMNKRNLNYKLILASAINTCDGDCIEFSYVLVWIEDSKIMNKIMHFATGY